jgi:hypothetical protein
LNFLINWPIFPKFGMIIMPLEDAPTVPFLISYGVGNNNMADAQTCEVEATLVPLNSDHQNDI